MGVTTAAHEVVHAVPALQGLVPQGAILTAGTVGYCAPARAPKPHTFVFDAGRAGQSSVARVPGRRSVSSRSGWPKTGNRQS